MLSPTSYSASRSIGRRIAASGKVLEKVIHQMLHRDFFRKSSSQDGGPRRYSAESLFAILAKLRTLPQNKMLSPLPQH